jgi:hypothetical protein
MILTNELANEEPDGNTSSHRYHSKSKREATGVLLG